MKQLNDKYIKDASGIKEIWLLLSACMLNMQDLEEGPNNFNETKKKKKKELTGEPKCWQHSK